MRVRLVLAAALALTALAAAPAHAATVVGTWDLGPLVDVRITKSGTTYLGRALNGVSKCGIAKNEVIWRFKGSGQVRFGTAEAITFPGGVCYAMASTVQAGFLLRAPNTLRVCVPNNRQPGFTPAVSFVPAGQATYPCADYRRRVPRARPPVGAVGALDYYARAYRSPSVRCPSTGPQTYNVFFKAVPADPMLRIDSVTINGAVPEVWEGGVQRGYVSVPTQLRRRYVTVAIRFTTESGRHLGIRVTWRPCT